MNDNNEKIQAENTTASLQDYEVEVAEKKGFLAKFFDKLKENKNQKLLNAGNSEKVQTTSRSISSMWGMGNFKATLFDTLDNVRHSLFGNKETAVKNGFATEIIGKTTKSDKDIVQTAEKVATVVPIIPKVKSSAVNAKVIPKGIINNAKSAEDVAAERKDSEEKTSIGTLEVEEIVVDEDIKTPVAEEMNVSDITIRQAESPKDSKEETRNSGR